jgi:co-chaperonin GroES (HSP10)
MKKQKYDPLEDRILVKEIKKTEPEKTEAGIITDTIRKETVQGIVVAAGPGFTARDTGTFIPTVLHRGDIVVYSPNSGMPLEVPNEEGGKDECRLMREGDILILVKKVDENN